MVAFTAALLPGCIASSLMTATFMNRMMPTLTPMKHPVEKTHPSTAWKLPIMKMVPIMITKILILSQVHYADLEYVSLSVFV